MDLRSMTTIMATSWIVLWGFAFHDRPPDGILLRDLIRRTTWPSFCRFWLRFSFGLCVLLFSLLVCLQAYHTVSTVFVVLLFHNFRPSLMIALPLCVGGLVGQWGGYIFSRHAAAIILCHFPCIGPRSCPCMGPFPPPLFFFLTGAGVISYWSSLRYTLFFGGGDLFFFLGLCVLMNGVLSQGRIVSCGGCSSLRVSLGLGLFQFKGVVLIDGPYGSLLLFCTWGTCIWVCSSVGLWDGVG